MELRSACTNSDCPPQSLRAANRPGTLFQPRWRFFGVGLPEGIVRSQDGGLSWQQVWSETAAGTVALSPDYDQDETLFASLDKVSPTLNARFIISNDGGDTWHGGGDGLCADRHTTVLEISPGFSQDQTLLASASSSSLFLSHDAGLTWQPVFPSTEPLCGFSDYGTVYAQFSPDFLQDRTIYAATYQGLYASYDAGESWRLIASDAHTVDLSVRRTPGSLVPSSETQAASSEKLWTDNGHRLYLPLVMTPVSTLPTRDLTLFMRAQPDGVSYYSQYRSNDGGVTWECMERPQVRRRAYLPLFHVSED